METNNTSPRHNIDPELAKTMVQSFQATFAPSDTTSIKVLTFDADAVRDYLSDTSIKNFAVFLAQTADWAKDHYGVANSAAMTVVLVGTDASGHAVKNSAGSFLDYADPCPSSCSSYNDPGFWE
ncbi:hypothetical protein ACTHGU_07690 [Chitinophagaceae bacterium MMS25-I14]